MRFQHHKATAALNIIAVDSQMIVINNYSLLIMSHFLHVQYCRRHFSKIYTKKFGIRLSMLLIIMTKYTYYMYLLSIKV